MVTSKVKLMFLIILPLQLSVTLSEENKHEIDGVSMTLHMKMRVKSGSTKKITVKEPLYYPSDKIEYYIKLSVGTPPQDLLLVMDTGSDLVWAPCTTNYSCNNCNGYTTVFLPRKSSSHVPIKCADPKCRDLCEDGQCVESFKKCSRICPHFNLHYGTGNTTGRLLSDTLTLALEEGGRREKKQFAIGCSVVSSVFSGIAGFGRGGLSMPSQLASLIGDKFAYCLDYRSNSSKIVLGNKAVPRDIALTYIPLLFNPVNPSHYYLGLQAVSIGAKRLTLPSNLLSFDSQGNGGTVIDSGSSVTLFPDSIYKQIVGIFASQIRYRRSPRGEVYTGSGLCYNVSDVENIRWPKFAFHFNGGSQMVLPEENGFSNYGGSDDVLCLAMQSRRIIAVNGPAVLIGNIQQNNFYILYDSEKNRLGFTQRACKTFR